MRSPTRWELDTSEVHHLGLFTTLELMQAFRDAGLEADHDPKGLTDRDSSWPEWPHND